MCTHIYVSIYNASVCTCICVYLYESIYIPMYIYFYVHLYMCVCILCLYTYVYVCILLGLCIYLHACMDTQQVLACTMAHMYKVAHQPPGRLLEAASIFTWMTFLLCSHPTRQSRIAPLYIRLCCEVMLRVGLRSVSVPNDLSALAWGSIQPCCSVLGFNTVETTLRAVLFCISVCPLSQGDPFIFN